MQKEEQERNEEDFDSLPCPSFNSYYTDQIAGIADQVSRDHYRAQNDDTFTVLQNDVFDFEFITFRMANGVFFDDTVFPLFNRDLLTEHRSGRDSTVEEDTAAAHRFPMARLLVGGGKDRRSRREPLPSSSESSSEADDLEGIPAGTYCVWTPNSVQASPSRCKKSNSAGSSSPALKPWKLLDLFRRSNSDGKDPLVLLTWPLPAKKKAKEQRSSEGIEVAGKPKGKGFAGGRKKALVHDALHVSNRELRRVDKRRSFLPYRQDLVGFFPSLNGLGRAFASF